jgi:hypothetical protein
LQRLWAIIFEIIVAWVTDVSANIFCTSAAAGIPVTTPANTPKLAVVLKRNFLPLWAAFSDRFEVISATVAF